MTDYKTPAQVKVILSLDDIDNTSDDDKPISTAQAAALQSLSNVLRNTQNLLQSIVWTEGSLLFNDGSVQSFSNYSVSQLMQVGSGGVISYIGGVNHSAQTIAIAGYDAAGVFVSALYSGAVSASTTTGAIFDNAQIIAIPANVSQIRFGQRNTAALTEARLISSPERYAEEEINKSLKSSADSNLLKFGRFYPTTSGATGTNANFKGTGWTPVSVGDEITWSLASTGGVFGIALYDASKTFIRFLEANSSIANIEKRHVLNASQDGAVAFMIGGHYSNDSVISQLGYIYTSSSNSLNRKINDAKLGPALGRGVRKITPALYSFTAGGVTIADQEGHKRITVNANPAYLASSTLEIPLENGIDTGLRAYRIKLVSIPSGAAATFYWHDTATDPSGYTPANSGNVTLSVGDEYIIWTDSKATRHVRCDLVGTVYDVLWAVEWQYSTATRATMENHHSKALAGIDEAYEERLGLSNFSLQSAEAHYLRSWAHGKKGAYFGNSLQYNMWPVLSPYLGSTMSNLTDGGSSPQENLTDGQLALIPSDVDFVTVSTGSGSAPASLSPSSAAFPWAGYHGYLTGFGTDLTSRDRTMSEGAINYAIDWITANRPSARIVLISPAYCGYLYRDNSKYQTLFEALADYHQLPLANVWRDADISARNWSPTGGGLITHDGIHLTAEGIKRQSGVVAGKFRSLSW